MKRLEIISRTAEKLLKEKKRLNLSINEAILEAKVLLEHFESGGSQVDLDKLIERRLDAEPIAYITGSQPFWKDSFKVSKDVLIPRADSEVLVETGLEILTDLEEYNRKINVMEIGVGSGCIILSLLKEKEEIYGVGLDISLKALEICQENSRKLNVNHRILLRKGDMTRINFGLKETEKLNAKLDLIISNPPYVEEGCFVNDYEPKLALYGDKDVKPIQEQLSRQNKYYGHIAKRIAESDLLDKTGSLLLEIGMNQADSVIDIISSISGLKYYQV